MNAPTVGDLRRRARAELGIRLIRRGTSYYAPSMHRGALIARDDEELRRVLQAWLAGRQP